MPVQGILVGRHAELDVIQSCLDGLRAVGPRERAAFVEIVGEPGIGKSRLLGEVAALAGERGQLVASGRATEFERGVPFGAVVEALDDHLADLHPQDRQRLCGSWLGLLAEVFPALQAWRPRSGAGVMEAERYRLHRAVRALLEALAEPSGLVLLLDDVHWADSGSVELLVHLVRHPPRAPVLIGVSYRVNRAPAALGAALADAAQGALVHRVELGPLTVHAAAELLGRPADQCRLLHEHSGGNPLYLQLLAGGSPTTPGPTEPRGIGDLDAVVPANLRFALLAELDSLTPTRRLVVQAAAVAGDPFDPELVAPTAAMETGETLEALDDLVSRDLLRVADDRRRFQFRHPLVRHLTYTSAGAGWRASAHRRLAAVLEQRGAPLVTRAHHVARAGKPADECTISLLLSAAEATLPSSPATAAEWLSAAISLLPVVADAMPRRLELLLGLADALGLSGQLEASRDTLIDALPLVPPESPTLRARVITSQASLERLLGRCPQARALLQSELDSLADLGAADAAAMLFEMAGSARADGGYACTAHRWAVQAVTASRDQDRPLYAAALSLLAAVFTELGDGLREGRARLLLGHAHAEARNHDDAVCELDRARALFTEAGALRLHAEAVRKLRRLGRRIPSPRTGPGAVAGQHDLTARERDVAALVMRGCSNRDIAERLVVSVRTVTTHVSHILAKLGVSSRVGIATAMDRTRQTADPPQA